MSLAKTPRLTVRERRYAAAHLVARSHDAPLAAQVLHAFGLTLPQGPHLVQAGALKLMGLSPGRWLALRADADHDFCADLASLLRAGAAVCDVSDAFTVFELRGTAVRAVLAKLIAIDLHERVFAPNQVAATVAAHIPVTLWRSPEEDGSVFELATPRSYEQTLLEVLAEAGAEYGLPRPP